LAETTADNWQQLTQQPSPAVSQQNYEVQVQAALAAIARGPLQKVVLSRIKKVPLPADTHPATLFEKLCAAYPQAFVSLVNLPGLGIWLGASPELLLQNEDDMFETMSLAGTRTTAGSMAPWTDKEIHEQLLVTDYIREKLREAGLQVEVAERETVQAGQVYHLRNLIRATGHASSFALVKTLHPTPAVCGLPADTARNYLLFHEAHQRSLYGGFLGPVDAQGHCQLYVNLRSMELHKGSASLYLGGGIVAGHQHMHLASHLGRGGQRLVGCVLDGGIVVFCNEEDRHQSAPASLSLATSSAGEPTLMPARRFGGSSVLTSLRRGVMSTP
jgi:isochorismate synthase